MIKRTLKMSVVLTTMLLSVCSFIACDNNEDNNPSEQTDLFNYEQILMNCNWNMQTFVKDSAYLINSNEELLLHTNLTDTNFGIDFANHSLILVWIISNSGINYITTDMQTNSSVGYNLFVNVYNYVTCVVEGRIVAILTNKLPNESIINCNVSFSFEEPTDK